MWEAGGRPTQGWNLYFVEESPGLGDKTPRLRERLEPCRPRSPLIEGLSQVPRKQLQVCLSGCQAWWVLRLVHTKFTSPLSATNPRGSGGLPRLTSSQGAHKRSPFSGNTHLPWGRGGHSLALPSLPSLSCCLWTDSGPACLPRVWLRAAQKWSLVKA